MYLAFTLDIDPDANCPHPRHHETVTANTERIYVDGCRQGLLIFHELLNTFSLPATLFWEARTLRIIARTCPGLLDKLINNPHLEHGCHAFRHEDLTGKETPQGPSTGELRGIINKATSLIRDLTHVSPRGFRAPYCRLPNKAIALLARSGYSYDASKSHHPNNSWDMGPYKLSNHRQNHTLWELAMTQWHDSAGSPIAGYLWQLLENKRAPQHYIHAIKNLANLYPDGLYQIGLHPWHLIKDAGGTYHPHPEKHSQQLRAILGNLVAQPDIEWITLENYLQLNLG